MFQKIKQWYDGLVARALAKQEMRLAADLEETKRLPRTPERQRLITETEKFLREGGSGDSMIGARIDATEADLQNLRNDLLIDKGRAERARMSRRIDKLADLSKRNN